MTTGLSPEARQMLDEHFAQSFARARRGRVTAKLMFVLACAAATEFAFFVVAAPSYIGAMYDGPDYGSLLQGVAFAGLVIGAAWMWRIIRGQEDPEAGARPWRYRGPDSDF